uniref:GATOR2 complex protein WDR24 n=1 Tax=Tetranychus urticae TaxID=32264 RepID=T1KSN4_TETUR
MARKSFYTVVEGSVNSLAINKDANHVVVAGRNVLKMFEIRDDTNSFVEKINLRVGKNQFNYNTNDIAWSHLDESLLATAATNGMIYIWNVERNARGKVENVFTDHRRTVNKICFHPGEGFLLLSGSQDGTMKLFDVRKKEASATFPSMSESVRDVQFSPFRNYNFTAVQENGNVQIWDLRRNDKPEKQFTAHNGPIYACDWHPEDRKWLATAGRDNTIKVWDISKKPNCCYCIQTMTSVARVVWRPHRRNNIASSSLNVDFSVYVWDIDRPYVPFAAFTEHPDVTTSILWRNDPHTLISAGKDATLYQHAFKDAERPASHANNVGLALNIHGDVALAISDYILKSNNNNSNNDHSKNLNRETTVGNSTFFPAIASYALNSNSNLNFSQFTSDKINPFKKNTDLTEKFKCSSSSLKIFHNTNMEKCLSMEWFVATALRYKLFGKPFAELCEHNAEVSKELNRAQVAQTWKILRLLYSTTKFGQNSGSSEMRSSATIGERPTGESKSRHVSKGTSGGGSVEPRPGGDNRVSSTSSINSLLIGGTRLFNNNESNANHDNEATISYLNDAKQPVDASTSAIDDQSGFFFGEEEIVSSMTNFTTDFDLTPSSTLFDGLENNHLFTESFRTTINEKSGSSDLDDTDSLDGINKDVHHSSLEDSDEPAKYLLTSNLPPLPTWKFNDLVIEMLQDYANKGDIQTTVSMMIVLGERLKNSLDESVQEFWVHSYIELLSRFQLWNVVNQIIRACNLPNINSINQTSTTIYTSCGKCQKGSASKVGWLCDKCKALPSQCSICHEIVKGLYIWCQGCSHGGHLQHITEWLKRSRECPSGCGHLCEYT